jgi:hypothetical protein
LNLPVSCLPDWRRICASFKSLGELAAEMARGGSGDDLYAQVTNSRCLFYLMTKFDAHLFSVSIGDFPVEVVETHTQIAEYCSPTT